MGKNFATSLGNFSVLLFPDIVEVRAEGRKSLTRLLRDTKMGGEIHKNYFYGSSRHFFYVRFSKADWEVLKRELEEHSKPHRLGLEESSTPIVEQKELSKDELRVLNEKLLLSAQESKPQETNSSWIEGIKEIAPLVYAVQDILDTGTYRGRPCDGRSAKFVLLWVNFGDSKMKMTLNEGYATKLDKIAVDYLCDFGDIDMVAHAISHFYQKRDDENFLLCLNTLLRRLHAVEKIAKSSTTAQQSTQDRVSIYEGNMKNLGYPARDNNEWGSISYHDNHGEESFGEEHENDIWDADGSTVFS